MKWLRRKIAEHNAKITYVDQEESWTARGWVISIITFTTLVSIPFVIIAACLGEMTFVTIGVISGILSVVWHFWHLLRY